MREQRHAELNALDRVAHCRRAGGRRGTHGVAVVGRLAGAHVERAKATAHCRRCGGVYLLSREFGTVVGSAADACFALRLGAVVTQERRNASSNKPG